MLKQEPKQEGLVEQLHEIDRARRFSQEQVQRQRADHNMFAVLFATEAEEMEKQKYQKSRYDTMMGFISRSKSAAEEAKNGPSSGGGGARGGAGKGVKPKESNKDKLLATLLGDARHAAMQKNYFEAMECYAAALDVNVMCADAWCVRKPASYFKEIRMSSAVSPSTTSMCTAYLAGTGGVWRWRSTKSSRGSSWTKSRRCMGPFPLELDVMPLVLLPSRRFWCQLKTDAMCSRWLDVSRCVFGDGGCWWRWLLVMVAAAVVLVMLAPGF